MTALPADELGLRVPIRLRFVPAWVAGSRRSARVDDPQVNASQGLIRQKRAKLKERPAGHAGSLLLAKPSAVADIRQLFACDSTAAVFSDGNEFFGDAMVHVAPEARFSGRDSFEFAADVLGPNLCLGFDRRGLLQGSSQAGVARPARLDVRTGMRRTVAGGGDINHAKIDADEVRRWKVDILWQINRYEQKPPAVFPSYEVALTLGRGKPFALILAHDVRQDSTGNGQERDTVDRLERSNTLIVRHRREWPEMRTLRLVALVRAANLGNATDCHLRRQSKPLAQRRIVRLLNRDLVSRLERERLTRQPICRRIEGAHRGFKLNHIILTRKELQLNRYDHQATIVGKHYRLNSHD